MDSGEPDLAVEDLTAAIEMGVKSKVLAYTSRGHVFRTLQLYDEAVDGE